MTIIKKNGLRSSYTCLATVATSLAMCSLSEGSDIKQEYVSPKAKFISIENYSYPIDCDVRNELAGPAGSN